MCNLSIRRVPQKATINFENLQAVNSVLSLMAAGKSTCVTSPAPVKPAEVDEQKARPLQLPSTCNGNRTERPSWADMSPGVPLEYTL